MFYKNIYAQEEKDAVESLPQEEYKSTTSTRDKPSSLNTQLYSAENFMKFSSPRRGCYMYNRNNNICENRFMEVEAEAYNANSATNLSQNYHQSINNGSNNTSNNNNLQQQLHMDADRHRMSKRKSVHDGNDMFIEEYSSLQKRQRLMVQRLCNEDLTNNFIKETEINLFNQKLDVINVLNCNDRQYGSHPSAGWF